MTKRKRLFLILAFLLFEVLVWVGCLLLLGDSALLVGFVLTVCGLTVLLVYILVARLSVAHSPAPTAAGPTAETAASQPSSSQAPAGKAGSGPALGLIQEANDQLAKSPTLATQRVKSTIFDFPLYFVFGTGGCGKTSLFLASEFQPELLAGQVLRDSAVVPTRLGNIWFTDSAVVVEAPGDIFSGDPAKWSDFVASFRRAGGNSRLDKMFGGTAPSRLGGVLLCCDAGVFVGVPDTTRLTALGRLAQQRLRTVGEIFGQDFPVYVVLTKSDYIPYFGDYFGRIDQREDQQILGCSFPDGGTSADGKDLVSGSLNRLYLSLADRRLEFLQREKETSKRPGIYEFPREFKRIRGTLVQLLTDIFRPNPLQPNPRLTGVYFVGTRKVAGQSIDPDRSIIQRVGDATRIFRTEDLQKQRSHGPDSPQREPEITRWTFVAELWQQMLQRRPVAAAPVVNQQQGLYRKTAYLTVAAVSGLAALLFLYSFCWNYFLVSNVKAASLATEAVPAGAVASDRNLVEIDKLREQLKDLDENRPGILRHFFYYKGPELREGVWPFYYTRFRQYFLNPVIRRLEGQFAALPSGQSSSDYRSVYGNLRTYRTITVSGQESSCVPNAGLADRLLELWRQDHPVDAEGEKIAKANFQFFAESLTTHALPEDLQQASQDDGRVHSARGYLLGFKGAAPQYERILDEANRGLQTARLQDLTHNTGYKSVMNVKDEVAAAFTKAGWDKVQQLIDSEGGGNSESCVLGKGNGAVAGFLAGADTKSQIRELYINDYIRAWKEFLATARVLPYGGCKDASDKLETLKDNNSPILATLLLATMNTTYATPAGGLAQQLGGKAKEAAKGGILNRLGFKATASLPGAKSLEAMTGGLNEGNINAIFQPAHVVFEASPPNLEHWADKRNTPYLEALGDLRLAMASLDRDGKCDDTNQAAHNQAAEALNKAEKSLDALTRNFDIVDTSGSVQALLESPLQGAKALLATSAPGESQKRSIGGAMGQMCDGLKKLQSKFPFNPQGDDAPLDQVQKVFDPNAGLLALLHQALADVVVQMGHTWTQKPDAAIKLSQPGLEFLNRAYEIADVLFPQPMKYKMSVQASSSLKRVAGPVNGVEIDMASKEYTWPSNSTVINLRAEPAGGGSNAMRSYTSTWGPFRLFAGADRHVPGSNQFQFIYVVADRGSTPQPVLPDGTPIVFEVTQFPNGVSTAFDKKFFAIPCPAKILE